MQEEVGEEDEPTGQMVPTGRKLLTVAKGNDSKPEEQQTLAFRIQSQTINVPDDELWIGRVAWDGRVEQTARQVWDQTTGQRPRKPSEKSKAEAFIKKAMRGEGGRGWRDRMSKEVEAEAKAAGISKRTLDRARTDLEIKTKQPEKPHGPHWWDAETLPAYWLEEDKRPAY